MAECARSDPQRNENPPGGHPQRRDQIPGLQRQLAKEAKALVWLRACGTTSQKPAETEGQREGTAQPLDDGAGGGGNDPYAQSQAQGVGRLLRLWEPFQR